MALWNGNFTITKRLDGLGWFVKHDGITLAYCVTRWGALRVLDRCKRNYELNQATERGK